MKRFTSLVLIAIMVVSGLGALLVWGGSEEVAGEISYDPGSNTIYVNHPTDLEGIWFEVSSNPEIDNSIFTRSGSTYYTNANIQINESGILTIDFGEKLKLYNSSQTLYIVVEGILNATGNQLLPVSFESNNAITSPGDWGGIQFLTPIASNSVFNYVNIYNASRAIECQDSNPTITNCNIGGNSENGIRLVGSTPTVTISDCDIYENGHSGIYFDTSSTIDIINTTFDNPLRDMFLTGSSNVISLESIFDDNKVPIDVGSSLTVKWYLDVEVREEGVSPIPGANVQVRDVGTGTFDESYTTAGDGFVRWIQIIEYVRDSSPPPIEYNPYNITVTASGYKPGFAEIYRKGVENRTVQIDLSILDIDLAVLQPEITFTNDQPIAGEIIYVDAIIHNYGDDNTSESGEMIQVNVYDNDTTHQTQQQLGQPLWIQYIEGNSFEEVTKKWTTTPGEHVIRVYVDPSYTIVESNELNNFADKYIFVNILPEVAITVPQEDDEINGSVLIEGTAFDSDDDGLTNNITRVEVSLDDLNDWQEAILSPWDPSYNLFNWSYSWADSTLWNETPINDGEHTIKARSWDGSGGAQYMVSEIGMVNITVNNTVPNVLPVVNITVSNTTVYENETITFNGTGSYDPDGSIVSYFWDFDDGSNSTAPIVDHAFNESRTFTVTLTVTDDRDDTNSTWILITILPNEAPTAVISSPSDSSEFNVSDVISFDGSESNDVQTPSEELNYTWDLDDTVDSDGDGNYTNDEDAYGNITTHRYETKGSYIITLKVTDEGGLNNTAWVTIEIWNYRPVGNISVSDTSPYENDTVSFNATTSYDPDGSVISYEWDFDDGTTSTGPIVDHVFNESRVFNVTLTTTDDNETTNVTWILIDVLPNAAPNAFIDDPNPGQIFDVNETIFFNGSGSSDLNDEDLEYFWDFGDGNTYLENKSYYPDGQYDGKTTHYYSEKGQFPLYEFTVRLTVRDDEDLEGTYQVTIVVNNYPPVAIAESNVTTAPTYQNITFDASDSYDPDQMIAFYEWDFDDGNTSNDEIAEHQFSQNGVYNVTLTIIDTFNANDTDWIIITITNRNPVIINVTAEPEEVRIFEVIWFNVTASDDDGLIVNYSWDFDDGTTYYETPSNAGDGAFDGRTNHSYSAKDTFTVTVTVEDDDGGFTPREIVISILNTPPEVNITSHEDGDTVENMVKIEGTAEDIDGDTISEVEVRIGSGDWEPAEDTSDNNDWSTWSYQWDTSPPETKNNPYTIYVRANDSFDMTDPLFSIHLTVDNDPTAITITMTLSETSVEAGETVTVSGKAEFDTGEPVQNTKVTVSILGGQMWNTTTDDDGLYSQDIIAPSEEDTYTVKVAITKGSLTDHDTDTLTVAGAAGKPDLTLSESDISFDITSPKTGDTVKIQAMIHNTGSQDATGVLVSFYDGDPDSGDFIESYSVDVTASGSSVASVDWQITNFVSIGTHTIWVAIDKNGLITEEDEENNEASKTIDIAGLPDLEISSENIDFSKYDPLEGETITIHITIENTGSSSATVDCDIYDGDPESGGVSITRKRVTVAAEDQYILDVDWTPEMAGRHDIYVVIDEDEEVDELNEDNNEAHQIIDVEGKEEPEPQNWVLIIFIIIVILAVIVLIYLNRIGKFGPSPREEEEEEIPSAEVVSKKFKKKPPKKEDKGEEPSLGGHGGIRLG